MAAHNLVSSISKSFTRAFLKFLLNCEDHVNGFLNFMSDSRQQPSVCLKALQ